MFGHACWWVKKKGKVGKRKMYVLSFTGKDSTSNRFCLILSLISFSFALFFKYLLKSANISAVTDVLTVSYSECIGMGCYVKQNNKEIKKIQ